MPEVTVEGQKRLKAARVLCIGAGGLGSPAALYLAAAGVGTLGIVDFDRVDLSNLQRQVAKIDTVEIDDAERSNAGCCQIKRSWGAETSGANAQNPRCFKSLLSLNGY